MTNIYRMRNNKQYKAAKLLCVQLKDEIKETFPFYNCRCDLELNRCAKSILNWVTQPPPNLNPAHLSPTYSSFFQGY